MKQITLPDQFAPPAGGLIRLSFEAKYTPEAGSGSARLGLGLMDARGWKATGNAVAAPHIATARQWKKLGATLKLLPDALAKSQPLFI